MSPSRCAATAISTLLWAALLGCEEPSFDLPNPESPSSGSPQADLSPGRIETVPRVRLDSLLQLTVGVRNSGPQSAGPGWFIRVLLSPDPAVDSADFIIDQFMATRELPPGGQDGYLRNLKLPGNLAPGRYFLGSMLDVAGTVPETNEGNNLALGPSITVLPRSPSD
jgi:CARDB